MIKNHLTFNDMDQLLNEKIYELATQKPDMMINLIGEGIIGSAFTSCIIN